MDPLSAALSDLNVKGELHSRKSLTSPWSVNVHQKENVVRIHIVHSGYCYVQLQSNRTPILIEQGDLVFIFQGESHTVYSDPSSDSASIAINQASSKPHALSPFGHEPANATIQMICGHYTNRGKSDTQILSMLPTTIHLKDTDVKFSRWINSTLELFTPTKFDPLPRSDAIISMTAEIALALAIRMHMHSIHQ